VSVGFSPEELAEAEIAAEAAIDNLETTREAFLGTFDTPAGRRVLLYLYTWCRQNKSTYSQGQDVTHTAFLEGRRSVVLKIMEMMNLDDMTIIERARNAALAR